MQHLWVDFIHECKDIVGFSQRDGIICGLWYLLAKQTLEPEAWPTDPSLCLFCWQSKSRKDILLEYVRNVQPEFMELFVKRAPQQVCAFLRMFSFHQVLLELVFRLISVCFCVVKQVVEAMRQTVTNMIGTLPPQFFAVTVTTVSLSFLLYGLACVPFYV